MKCAGCLKSDEMIKKMAQQIDSVEPLFILKRVENRANQQ